MRAAFAATAGMFLLTLAPLPAAAQSLEELAFLAGCWEGEAGASTIEERWTGPSDNLMLATTRYLQEGRTTFYEFSRLERTEAGVVLTPYPGGRPSEHGFRLTRIEAGEAVFEAPEHDFPRRILYRREGDDALGVRIDGGEGAGEAREWRLRRVSCG